MRHDGGVASEGRVVGVPKFYSSGKCHQQISTQIGCPRLSLARVLYCYIILYYIEQSNPTSRCTLKASAVGLPWFEHFRHA